MSRWVPLLALVLVGCVSERAVELVIEPPRDAMGAPAVPADAASWEVRVLRVGDDDACPGLEASVEARPFGELADAQSFPVAGVGAAVGELPSGRWAFAAIARDAECRPVLYGCIVVELSGEAGTIVIPVEAADSASTCGCRSCSTGACDEVQRVCA